MERIVSISAAADVLGVPISLLRGWQAGGRTYGGQSSRRRSRQAQPGTVSRRRKLRGVSLWRGTLWRGSQEARQTGLEEAGTERRALQKL